MDTLDATDRRLLELLQHDGKMSLQELAEATNLSTSPCWRRIRKLEELGVINRYVAVLDRRKLGLNAMAYVQVQLIDHSEDTIGAFDRFVQTEPQVVECASITGSNDYMLKVVAQDPESLETFLLKRILRLGLVRSSHTHFMLRQTKSSTALPV